MAKFELVSRFKQLTNVAFALPQRATAHAAGYDLYAAEDVVIPPYEELMRQFKAQSDLGCYSLVQLAALTKSTSTKPTLVSTGMKVKLDPDEYLEILPRSSTPLKYWLILANSAGIIDADYYNNPDNEGEIFLQFINLSPHYISIHRGDFLGQGIIHKYYTTEDDCAGGERQGGFGSTH
jgi:dUTP pyrophosphatase